MNICSSFSERTILLKNNNNNDTNTKNIIIGAENTYVEFVGEFQHIQDWANANGMVINLYKTKEIVLHRSHPSQRSVPQSLEGIE